MSERVRVLVAGEGEGEVLVSREPLSLWGGLDPSTGRIIDERHPDLGQTVTGKVWLLPRGRGSSSASSILLEAVRQRTAPVALITLEVDPILVLGAAVAREMYGRAPAVLRAESEPWERFAESRRLRVRADGRVEVLTAS